MNPATNLARAIPDETAARYEFTELRRRCAAFLFRLEMLAPEKEKAASPNQGEAAETTNRDGNHDEHGKPRG